MAAYAARCMLGQVDELGSGFAFEVRRLCVLRAGLWRRVLAADSLCDRLAYGTCTALRPHDALLRVQGGAARVLQRSAAQRRGA